MLQLLAGQPLVCSSGESDWPHDLVIILQLLPLTYGALKLRRWLRRQRLDKHTSPNITGTCNPQILLVVFHADVASSDICWLRGCAFFSTVGLMAGDNICPLLKPLLFGIARWFPPRAATTVIWVSHVWQIHVGWCSEFNLREEPTVLFHQATHSRYHSKFAIMCKVSLAE